MAKFILYQDDNTYQFRRMFQGDKNKILAQSHDSYRIYEECEKAIRYIKVVAPSAVIEDQTPPATRLRDL